MIVEAIIYKDTWKPAHSFDTMFIYLMPVSDNQSHSGYYTFPVVYY